MGDENGDGAVSASEASRYTTERVQSWAFNNNKNQNPRMKANVSGQILLTVNREGERLAKMQAQRQQVEQELAQVQRQLQQAQGASSSVSEAEARQQEAERQEKVRRAKAEEAVERQRKKVAQQQREEAKREQAEVERQRQRLEAGQQRLQSQQLEAMDIGQLLKKAKELQRKIDQVRPQVKAEINRQIAAVPQPDQRKVSAKDEFETQAMYQQRLKKAGQRDGIAEERHQREVDRIRATINSEIKARSQGYQEALSLLNRELVLDEEQMELRLRSYDAERQSCG